MSKIKKMEEQARAYADIVATTEYHKTILVKAYMAGVEAQARATISHQKEMME